MMMMMMMRWRCWWWGPCKTISRSDRRLFVSACCNRIERRFQSSAFFLSFLSLATPLVQGFGVCVIKPVPKQPARILKNFETRIATFFSITHSHACSIRHNATKKKRIRRVGRKTQRRERKRERETEKEKKAKYFWRRSQATESTLVKDGGTCSVKQSGKVLVWRKLMSKMNTNSKTLISRWQDKIKRVVPCLS